MRERLTITLKKDILDALDLAIDGQSLRNRSHAIEYFLSKSLGTQGSKVLILAGGKPVDFGGDEKKLPKAMVKIAGKPLLDHTLQRLKMEKFSDVIISVGEGGKTIEQHFLEGGNNGLQLRYLYQQKANTGTAGAILQAKSYLDSGTFVVWYGDVLSDIDLNELMAFHKNQATAVCTMALTSVETPNMWGVARLTGSRIVSFEEKPEKAKTYSHLVNAGVYIMEPEIFKYLTPSSDKLERDVLPRLAEEGKLAGFPFEGLWLDISSSAAYKQAIKEISNSK